MKSMEELRGMNRDQMTAYAQEPKNRHIVAIPVLLVLSFGFYVLSAFFAAALGDGSVEPA